MITKKLLRYKFLSFLFVLNACSTTGYIVEEVDGPLAEIQKVVAENLSEGVGFVTKNQRNFYSKKFSINTSKTKVSSIMRISILGDRRPYSLQLKVHVATDSKNIQEAFEQGEESPVSDSYSKRTYSRIKEQLTKRLKNKNLFDDFRPF